MGFSDNVMCMYWWRQIAGDGNTPKSRQDEIHRRLTPRRENETTESANRRYKTQQVGTGGATSGKTMLWWVMNAVCSKTVAYFVCYYTFKSFWATVCKMVRPMLSVRCLCVCLSVCLSVLSVCLSFLSCLWRSCTMAKRLDGSRRNLACR